MDGRSAVANVLFGVLLGAAVPILGAVALSQAHPEFIWLDHFLTILLLSIFCAAIGVLVNLPWQSMSGAANASALHQRRHRRPVAPDEEPLREEYVFDDGFDSTVDDGCTESTSDRQRRRPRGQSPPTSFAMSRRAALRVLNLTHDADEAQVRDAFRRLAREHHPDRATAQGAEAVSRATERFQRIRAAYEVLLADEGT